VITKATRTGFNPRNTTTQKLNSNRVQRAGGNTQGKLKQNSPAAKLVQSTRTKASMQRQPFTGYNLLANSRTVPAGRGNIRNAGTVTKGTVQKIRQMHKIPSNALDNKGSFGRFMGGK